MEMRDLSKEPLGEAELDSLIGEGDYRKFLNPKSQLYLERDMEHNPPPRAAAIRLMVENPKLIRKPIVVSGKKIVIGYDEEGLKGLE